MQNSKKHIHNTNILVIVHRNRSNCMYSADTATVPTHLGYAVPTPQSDISDTPETPSLLCNRLNAVQCLEYPCKR